MLFLENAMFCKIRQFGLFMVQSQTVFFFGNLPQLTFGGERGKEGSGGQVRVSLVGSRSWKEGRRRLEGENERGEEEGEGEGGYPREKQIVRTP
jgi:hypothetical protein